jgi:hypothetical protein
MTKGFKNRQFAIKVINSTRREKASTNVYWLAKQTATATATVSSS